MKQKDIQRAAELVANRLDIFRLKTHALCGMITISAGKDPIAVTGPVVDAIVGLLLTSNTAELAELGITDLSQWSMPQRPPEKAP